MSPCVAPWRMRTDALVGMAGDDSVVFDGIFFHGLLDGIGACAWRSPAPFHVLLVDLELHGN